MIIVSDTADLSRIANPAIRKLVELRLQQLHSPDDLDSETVELIVVESGDSVAVIEQAAGVPLLCGLLDDLPFDHPDFYPNHEILEEFIYEQCHCYEMVFGCGADGAVAIFISDTEGIDADLLAMCRSWATPACEAAVSTP